MKQFEKIIEKAELYGELEQIKNELDFIHQTFGREYLQQWVIVKIEKRRSVLGFRFEQIMSRMQNLTQELKQLKKTK